LNQKLILGFVAGALAAAGVSYLTGVSNLRLHRQPSAPVEAAPAAAVAPGPVPAVAPEPAPAPQPQPKPGARKRPTPAPRAGVPVAAPPPQETASVTPPPAPEPPPPPPSAPVVTPVVVPAPPPAPEPAHVTLTPGTVLSVRFSQALSSDRSRQGDVFGGTLDQPLEIDGFVVAERGARVEGRVSEVQEAGRVKGLAQLTLELTRLHTSDGQSIPIRTTQFVQQGPASKKEDAEKIGAGAVLGTIIGAIAGGGKGAAIGAAAGGAAGAGTVAATRGKPAVLPAESRVSFRIDQPVEITEQSR